MDFLEECKVRLVDAQKRVQTTQQDLATAQNRHQAALQEYNSLQIMINTETARRAESSGGNAVPAPQKPTLVVEGPPTQTSDVNKTDMIRELLRQHPTGMTPTEIWRDVKSQMNHRAYLYSVLGRLKDRDEVIVRRKKYFLKAEEKEQAVVH